MFAGTLLSHIRTFSPKDIEQLIRSSKPTSCDYDPIPTKLLIKHLDLLISPITKIVNISPQNGVFPNSFKGAMVRSLLKKSGLDPQDLRNFRPVSNLSFISKIIEKAVHSCLKEHLLSHDLLDSFQSAHRQYYSTERDSIAPGTMLLPLSQ